MTATRRRLRHLLLVQCLMLTLTGLSAAPASGDGHELERARLTWDTETDIDLHIWDELGNHAWYGNATGIPDATLSEDDTLGYGPEFVVDADAGSNRTFTYAVCYFSGAPATNVSLALTDADGTERIETAHLTQEGDGAILGSSPLGGQFVPPEYFSKCSTRAVRNHCEDNRRPSAGIFSKPTDWRRGQAATNAAVKMSFNGIGRDPDGDALTYTWLFRDAAGVVSKAGKSVAHSWSTAGSGRDRTATVTVTDVCGNKAAAGVSLWISGDPGKDFAPVMRLHPNEKYWPMSAGRFVAKSALWYARSGWPNKRIKADPRAGGLGRGAYSHKQWGKRFKTDDLTRPFAPANASPQREAGFYLELPDGARAGSAPSNGRITSPMYLQKVRNK